MFARVRSLIRALTSRGRFGAGMKEELRFHIDQYAEDLVRSGVSPEEARRRARMEFGGIKRSRETAARRAACGYSMTPVISRHCKFPCY